MWLEVVQDGIEEATRPLEWQRIDRRYHCSPQVPLFFAFLLLFYDIKKDAASLMCVFVFREDNGDGCSSERVLHLLAALQEGDPHPRPLRCTAIEIIPSLFFSDSIFIENAPYPHS